MLVHLTNHIQSVSVSELAHARVYVSVCLLYMHALCILVYLYKQFQLIIVYIYIVYSIDLFIHF